MKAACLLMLGFCVATRAMTHPAYVLRCHDADTCTVSRGQRVESIRLAEIDAPEIDQPNGTKARDVLCPKVCGPNVEIEPRGTNYDRVVGLVLVGGVDISEAMVRVGAAWDYVRFDHDAAMPGLKQAARAGRLGLWADPTPVAPWDWRHSRVGRFTPQW